MAVSVVMHHLVLERSHDYIPFAITSEIAKCFRNVRKSALVLCRDKKLLVGRSDAEPLLFLPGGQIDGEEGADAALCREVLEQCSVVLKPSDLIRFGNFVVPAYGEPGVAVHMTTFSLKVGTKWPSDAKASRELTELRWICGQDVDCLPQGLGLLLGHLVDIGLVTSSAQV